MDRGVEYPRGNFPWEGFTSRSFERERLGSSVDGLPRDRRHLLTGQGEWFDLSLPSGPILSAIGARALCAELSAEAYEMRISSIWAPSPCRRVRHRTCSARADGPGQNERLQLEPLSDHEDAPHR